MERGVRTVNEAQYNIFTLYEYRIQISDLHI